MAIRVIKVRKKFQNFLVLDDVSIDISSGEFMALLGPSGSGKTTLLRVIAGLEQLEEGEVLLEGEKQHVGFVFQHYALFRHMTVFENVAFGLKVRLHKLSRAEIRDRVLRLLRLVHLEGLESQYPSHLSGGQRQRVALARVLAIEPSVMLLDEPFGALDAKVRKELRQWLRKLHDAMNITTIFVTHDQEEAMEIADKIAVMNQGKIVQIGTPDEIWHHPANAFVYDFLGNYNEFIGRKTENGLIHLCEEDELPKPRPQPIVEKKRWFKKWWRRPTPSVIENIPQVSQKYVKLFVRPYEISLSKEKPLEESITAQIVHINPAGPLIKIELERANGQIVQAEVSKELLNELQARKGDLVWVTPKSYKIFE